MTQRFPSAPAQRGARVEFRSVTKRFSDRSSDGGRWIAGVEGLTLEVEPGEICVLVGPSGCGKTTTLRMVNRLIEPTSGQILLDGCDVATLDLVALRRRIGYVIQQIGLFPHQTVGENVATVPRLLGWDRKRIEARVDELISLVGLDPARVRGAYPAQLSGGERQRIGVARAMAAEPPVLLMDEPFGAVDPIVRSRLQDEFLRIQRALSTTVIFVTHDIDEAIKIGTRVAVMQEGGRLVQYSRPMDLLLRPANEYVARFVGSDRVLKSLALVSVDDLAIDHRARPPATAHRVARDTTALEALGLLVATDDHVAAVVDDRGETIGVLRLDAFTASLGAHLDAAAARSSPDSPAAVARERRQSGDA
ncbi:MAG TPA: ABC transporter ATP-binding protein [Chloroflexota bacterium]|nr:ABC transporter ATP-binding protein [Chloroflexota bacterium]